NLKTKVSKNGKLITEGYDISIQNGKLNFETSQSGSYAIEFKGVSKKIVIKEIPKPIEFIGAWTVSFTAGWGAPETVVFNKLISWSENADNGIKYYSGTARYINELKVTKKMLGENSKLTLDLGEVRDLAEIIVNGKSLGVIWKPPFRIDVTSVLKVGKNKLEIKVTNVWVNRLIGDEVEGGKRYLNPITRNHYDEPSEQKLFPSGLLGPVQLKTSIKEEF
ncbi:MAG: glycosylhydrolase-like jelly roll fold domain-containing protein, partial [Paludibacter sp.]